MGRTSPPIAITVMPEPPVKVVKRAQTAMTITARPPGTQPRIDLKKRRRRSDASLSAST